MQIARLLGTKLSFFKFIETRLPDVACRRCIIQSRCATFPPGPHFAWPRQVPSRAPPSGSPPRTGRFPHKPPPASATPSGFRRREDVPPARPVPLLLHHFE